MFDKLKHFIEKILSFNFGSIFKTEINNKVADNVEGNKLLEINNDNSQQISQQNFYIGIQYKDLIDIVQREQSLANNKLMSKIEPRLLPENIDKIKNDFDFLDTYREAVKISAKRKDEITDDMLADIISERIKESNDFSKIILNESINTIGKLTQSQIEILHIVALFHKCKQNAKNLEELITMLSITYKPLYDREFKLYDFEYLLYAGCLVSIEPGNIEYDQIYTSEKYPGIDMDALKQSDVYQFLKTKWNKSGFCKYKPTTIGLYVGLKYHKIKFNVEIPNIEKAMIK